MNYEHTAIPDSTVPRARIPGLQYLIDTYVSESNKVVSTWDEFSENDLDYRPHPKSTTVRDIMKHQLLSERRFFAEFLGVPEPPAAEILPQELTRENCVRRFIELVRERLSFLANQSEEWWHEKRPFFDVERERIWIFWRRVLHTAHHRTQLTVYLRLLEHKVPATYGPTADVTWSGADPTNTVGAAGRK